MTFQLFGRKIILIVIFFAFVNTYKGATCIALASGNWTVAANWSCGVVPGCGDSIVIPAGRSVSITTQQDYSGCGTAMKLTIYGNLIFQNGNKLKLPCGSKIYLMAGGSIQAGGGGGNANNIEICGAVVWNAGAGPIMGPCTIPPGGCEPLPIELSSFTATVNGSEVDLLWTTLSEKNNLKFDIQRSDDAINFGIIGSENTKAKAGNSQIQLNYVYSDKDPLANTNYYRLKQIDIDKSFNYSRIISVSRIKETNIKFIIYPNPNHGEFTADISGVENNHNVSLFLYDIKGELHYHSNFYIQDSQNTKIQIVPDNKLANGIYTCTFMVEEVAFKVKVVVN